jgi:Lar family restriction alleviation protein
VSEKKLMLKPCPFCGGLGVADEHFVSFDNGFCADDGFVVECATCGVEMVRDTTKEAIAAWNRRAK